MRAEQTGRVADDCIRSALELDDAGQTIICQPLPDPNFDTEISAEIGGHYGGRPLR